jgi:hypothetical protein
MNEEAAARVGPQQQQKKTLRQRLSSNQSRNAKRVSKLNSLLFSMSNFMPNNGSMQDLPFRNPFWHSERKVSACAFNFSFKIN